MYVVTGAAWGTTFRLSDCRIFGLAVKDIAKGARLSKYGNEEWAVRRWFMMMHWAKYVVSMMFNVSTKRLLKCKISVEDQEILSKFLPLLRERNPDAAEEIESDMCALAPRQDSDNEYVYDLYAVNDKMVETEASYPFHLVQVDDDDQFFDGLDDSDYETDDSNDHPCNDYPEEESSDNKEEEESSISGSQSEEEGDDDDDDDRWKI